MGKPYGHTYYFAGPPGNSAGTMICACCHKPIDATAEDWMYYTKPKRGDWGYVCFHRRCRPDDTGWAKREAEIAKHLERNKRLVVAAIAFRDEWNVDCLDDLIDALS